MHWHIGEILVQKKLITWDQLNECLEEREQSKEYTGEILIRKGYVSARLVYKALAEQTDMEFVDLSRTHINPRAIDKVPQSIAEKYFLMPIELTGDTLIIGISNPIHVWPEADLKQLAQVQEIRVVLCMPDDIEANLRKAYDDLKAKNEDHIPEWIA